MSRQTVRFAGKDTGIFSVDMPYERINSNTLRIGVRIAPTWKKRVKVNKEISIPSSDKTAYNRWIGCRLRAKRKNLDFDLDVNYINDLIHKPCVYCHDEAKLSEIDCKDSSKGYTINNVAPACRRCNTIKNNVVSYDEMMKIVEVLGWRNRSLTS